MSQQTLIIYLKNPAFKEELKTMAKNNHVSVSELVYNILANSLKADKPKLSDKYAGKLKNINKTTLADINESMSEFRSTLSLNIDK